MLGWDFFGRIGPIFFIYLFVLTNMPLDTNLHKKAYNGEKESVEDLLNEGEDPNVRGAQNRTALHRAAGANHVDVCKVLLARGADPSICDDSGRTAVHWAALGGSVGSAELFQAVDVNAKSKSGSTALHCTRFTICFVN